MIESEWRERRDRKPTRIAIGISESVKLLQEHAGDSGFFLEFSRGSLHQGFATLYESAGNGPLAFKRFDVTFDQHDLQGLFFEIQSEDHAINRQSRPFVLVLKCHRHS